MASSDPKKRYIDIMNRAIRDAAGLAPGGPLAEALAKRTPKFPANATIVKAMADGGLGASLAAVKASETAVGMSEAMYEAMRGQGSRAALAPAMEAAIRGQGRLGDLFESMTRQTNVRGRSNAYADQLQALARPVMGDKLDRIIGVNAAAAATREALTRTSAFAAHGQALADLIRQAGLSATADISRSADQLRLATEAAATLAPDLVGPEPSAELARSLADDDETFPNITLTELDQRIEAGVIRALGASGLTTPGPGAATRAAQTLAIMVLSVVVDRAVPEQEDLVRWILTLVHYIRTF